MMHSATHYNVLLLGGGLANGFLAYHLARFRPEIKFAIIEKNPTLGGHHTWSFHERDVSAAAMRWLRPLLSKSWETHQVRFPKYHRTLASRYHSIRSSHFHSVVTSQLHGRPLFLNETIQNVTENTVTLSSGVRLTGDVLLDGRGLGALTAGSAGFQKFLGIDLELEAPHGISAPLLMDATCTQKDGYRFIYVLPWTKTSCLVEDTRYSNTAAIDSEEYRQEIRSYAKSKGWKIIRESHEEQAALPIPLRRNFQTVSNNGHTVGNAGAFFHPTTGYSLPESIKMIETLAGLQLFTNETVQAALSELRRRTQKQWTFLLGLNRMLFLGAAPDARYRILERFYTLPEQTIARFYAMELSIGDMARILIGKPPVPFRSAIPALLGRTAHAS